MVRISGRHEKTPARTKELIRGHQPARIKGFNVEQQQGVFTAPNGAAVVDKYWRSWGSDAATGYRLQTWRRRRCRAQARSNTTNLGGYPNELNLVFVQYYVPGLK